MTRLLSTLTHSVLSLCLVDHRTFITERQGTRLRARTKGLPIRPETSTLAVSGTREVSILPPDKGSGSSRIAVSPSGGKARKGLTN